MKTVGERIKELRMNLGLSQVEFAEAINVSKQTLYKYENNIITNIPSDKIEAIAAKFGVSPASLMGWEDDRQPSYYLDPETARIAQAIFENKGMRTLFDAAANSRPEDLKMAADLLARLKGTNPDA